MVAGYNCKEKVVPCLDSIAALNGGIHYEVAIADGGSDDGTGILAGDYAQDRGWTFLPADRRRYALESQIDAWRALEPGPGDVVVWVDLDDRLARADALEIVYRCYQRGAKLTYGSYKPDPITDPTAGSCRPATPYPTEIVQRGAYRRVASLFNHLRTVSWDVLKHISDDDLRTPVAGGDYFTSNTDRAVMFPALELAGGRHAFISTVLYHYSCDLAGAIWRSQFDMLQAEDRELRARAPKAALRK